MAFADAIALRSRCSRAQVGAVIVSHDQRVLSSGYNGPPRGLDVTGPCDQWCPRAMGTGSLDGLYDDCHAAHAEANAIARADFTQMDGASIYVSTSACKGCAKQLANTGIIRLVYRYVNDKSDGYRNPAVTEAFLKECGIEVVRWPSE